MSARPGGGLHPESALNSGGGGTIRRNGTLGRSKTLSRPDRYHTPETMFKKRKEDEPASCWVICSRITTCWALPPFMRMCGIHDKQVQQAWREKFTLCFIILLIGGMVAFLTIGFSFLLCPSNQRNNAQTFVRYADPTSQGLFGINGYIYDANTPGALYPSWFNYEDVAAGAVAGAQVQDLHTILLVTCYSEGESSLRTTIESLAATEYPDNKKLLFIICDGIITGSGNDRSTPEICSSLMELDPTFDSDPTPQSYLAVAAGSKQHNRAKVYAGYFRWKNRRVPTVLVVKCGNEEEHEKPKAGNRGKRDSQLILMNFFSRVTYNDRMTPLDYELFRKIQHLMQVTPDKFEIVLMVDADTKVYPSSLRLLMNCIINDPLIMGLCGETKIANKRQSWVTAIQVFEYYISHHLGKGFESVFGGVTCLPGCFCMYRLKARKGDDWVPIITKPEIVQEYSQNIVETLHQKNLLLLGEDRFLTTLMLRNFPNRKMMFMPQAICKTVVPDEFSVLLSQRRRWINSTIHNLLELVLVRNLCGTFCFSMQFVILMELIGTVVLPVALILTVVLIVNLATMHIQTLAQAAPLILLVFVLTMPAVLILLTTRKLIYIAWMIVYLLALPVWNFILPVYAYWHFDDFSWGETRKVAGEAKGEAHGNADGMFDSSKVPLKRWDDYEKARVRQVKRIERAERQRHQGSSPYIRAVGSSIYTDSGDSKTEILAGDLGPQQYHFDYNGRQIMSPPLMGNPSRAMMGTPSPHLSPQQQHLRTMNSASSLNWNGSNTAPGTPASGPFTGGMPPPSPMIM
ncbi:Chitin synthase, class 1, partial [Haplosporangium bisporale]